MRPASIGSWPDAEYVVSRRRELTKSQDPTVILDVHAVRTLAVLQQRDMTKYVS